MSAGGAARWALPGALLLAGVLVAAQAQEGGRGRRGALAPAPADEPDRTAIERNTLVAEFSEHLRDVRRRLNIQPAQQPAWDQFEHRTEALMLDQMRGIAPPPEHEDALHQINRRVDVVRDRLAAMEDIADAAAHLYAVLTQEQRRKADELLASAVPSLYSGLPDLGKGPRSARPAK